MEEKQKRAQKKKRQSDGSWRAGRIGGGPGLPRSAVSRQTRIGRQMKENLRIKGGMEETTGNVKCEPPERESGRGEVGYNGGRERGVGGFQNR